MALKLHSPIYKTAYKSYYHTQYCSAPSCNNSRGKCEEMSFFRFPRDEPRCKKWIENCGRPELLRIAVEQMYRNRVLCCVHFEDSQFMNTKSRNRLIWNAIPTLFDVPNPPLNIEQEKASGTSTFFRESASASSPPYGSEDDGDFEFPPNESEVAVAVLKKSVETKEEREGEDGGDRTVEISSVEEVSRLCESNISAALVMKNPRVSTVVANPQQLRKTKMRQLINRQRVKVWRLKKQVEMLKSRVPVKADTVEDLINGASKYLSGIALNFFANQLRIASKKKQGKRWTKDDKLFALSLNLVSTEAYHLCSKVFSLPTSRTLQRWLRCFKNQSNFEELELNPFKAKLLGKTNNEIGEENETRKSENVTNLTADDELILEALSQCLNPSASEPATTDVVVVASEEPTAIANEVNVQVAQSGKRQSESKNAIYSSKRTYLIPRILNGNRTKPPSEPQQFQLQLRSDQLDANTLKLIADARNLNANATITAVQETNSEGTMMLTPITEGVPITLSEDTINLEIVTLGTSGETVNVMELV